MLDIQQFIGVPKIAYDEIDPYTTRFELQYLPRGFGHTIGNAMRRLLLGYYYGGAVTALKIKGVTHEYSVVEGVKESVLDILLSFKKLHFKVSESGEKLQWISQRFSGIGQVTTADLKLPFGVEILDEDVYLFEITDPGVELIIEYRIEKGYGYYSLDFLRRREEKKGGSDVNILLVDNDFKAVEYVKYEVEEIIDDFMGGVKDKLILEVKTLSNKVTAKDMLAFAGEVMVSYCKLFVFDEAYIDKSSLIEMEDLQIVQQAEEINVKTMPIDALPLSERTRNALIKNNILYVEDLEKKKKVELLTMKGIGKKAVDEIVAALGNIGKNLNG